MARRPREGPRPADGDVHARHTDDAAPPALVALSEVQMVPRLPDALSAPQSTLVYHQPMSHPAERAGALREALGLPTLALFPTLRHRDADAAPGGQSASCHQ